MSDPTITWPGHVASQASLSGGTEGRIPDPALVLPGEARGLHAFGDEIFVHLGGAETGGNYTMFTDITPPGGGPPPHYHDNEDEWFFPLEGRVEFFLDGSWRELPPQSLVFIPRGTVHTFRNCGDTPLKMLVHTAPAGFEIFFRRCAAEFAKPGPPDMQRIMEISAEHGIYFVTA
jgi:quercetin dioxygenase-like cupin family protein